MDLSMYNERLDRLHEQMAQRDKLTAMLNGLQQQKMQLKARLSDLLHEMNREQADVDRLEGGFRSIFFSLIGKKEDMLEKERAEALKAAMQYDIARGELESVLKEIDRLEWEKVDLDRYAREYEQVLQEKRNAMNGQGEAGRQIMQLEEEKRALAARLTEIEEAQAAGRQVLAQADIIASSLNSAEDWGTWDLFGGGWISDMAKHSHLDDAQEGVRRLEHLLRNFHTELTDVSVHVEIQAQVDGFLRFADWFFDGFLVDWAVLSRIEQAQSGLQDVRGRVQRVMDQLNGMRRADQQRTKSIDQEIRQLVQGA